MYLKLPLEWFGAFPDSSVKPLAMVLLAYFALRYREKGDGSRYFHGDRLAVTYQSLELKFGAGKYQIRSALDYLEKARAIRRDFDESNAMFIELDVPFLEHTLMRFSHDPLMRFPHDPHVDSTRPSCGFHMSHIKEVQRSTKKYFSGAIAPQNDRHQEIEKMKPVKKGKNRYSAKEGLKLYQDQAMALSKARADIALEKPGMYALAEVWSYNLPLHFEIAKAMLTKKQAGQLSLIGRKAGTDAARLIRWAIENWSTLTDRVRHDFGSGRFPKVPDVGYLLANVQTADALYRESLKAKAPQKQAVLKTVRLRKTTGTLSDVAEQMTEEEFLKVTGLVAAGGKNENGT